MPMERTNAQERKIRRAYRARHADRLRARQALHIAVKKGLVKRAACCSTCPETEKIEAHHNDYSQPLDVAWLCYKCHIKLHVMLREAQNA
jgi:hypothetical protein